MQKRYEQWHNSLGDSITQTEQVIDTEDVTPEEAKILLIMNAIVGGFFVLCLIATILMLVKRNISDLFMSRSLYCMIGALLVTIVMCFIMSSYKPELFLDKQTVPFQQVYFELPFYLFLIVVMSILCSWEEAYQMYVLQCKETDADLEQVESTDCGNKQALLENENEGANDKVQQKQEQVEKRLGCYFNWYLWLILTMQSLETFFVIFHKFDYGATDDTPRYRFGWVLYMTIFFIQAAMLIGTYFFAWTVYIRLALFLKPSIDQADEDDYQLEEQIQLKHNTEFEKRRDIIRQQFQPRYLWLNVVFIYILFTLTMRTGIYVGLRLTSSQKIFEWTQIRPVVFYLTYTTDFLIVCGVLYFVQSSTQLKQTGSTQADSSVFPTITDTGQNILFHDDVNKTVEQSDDTESQDGDELIRQKRAIAQLNESD